MKTQQNQKITLGVALASLGLLASSQAQTFNAISQVEIPVGYSQIQSPLSSPGSTTVYDNLSTTATAGTSYPNSVNPIYGDALNCTLGGQLSTVGMSIYNSTSGGNTGSIVAGTMTFNIYDNTIPYSGGSLSGSLPLIASVSIGIDFSSSPLLAGYYDTFTSDLTSLNITIPQNIFVTQQFTQTTGTSLRNGVILFGNPVTGSSPANVYMVNSGLAEGLYTFSSNPNQFGYSIEVVAVPEPATLALAGLGGLGVLLFRRQRK